MSVILVFLLVIVGFAGWWLSHQRLMAKPWLEQGVIGDVVGMEGSALPTAKIGLGVFLAVVGCLFALFTSAYFMRMALSDWQALPLPRVLWFNTGVLVLSSIALQCASVAARRGEIDAVRLGLVTAGLTALAFLVGQLVAWRELTADGYLLTANPANSFFYLITGMHGLHIL
jgi:cytochrome c oxidase subunit III